MHLTFDQWYVLITTLISLWWLAHLVYRMINPHKCECSFQSRSLWRFKRHVLAKHRWM